MEIGKLYWMDKPKSKFQYLVICTDGQFMGSYNMVSNFWTWEYVYTDGSQGEPLHYYDNGFYCFDECKDYEVITKKVITKIERK